MVLSLHVMVLSLHGVKPHQVLSLHSDGFIITSCGFIITWCETPSFIITPCKFYHYIMWFYHMVWFYHVMINPHHVMIKPLPYDGFTTPCMIGPHHVWFYHYMCGFIITWCGFIITCNVLSLHNVV